MKVKFKDGGMLDISDMPMDLFDAAQDILWQVQQSHLIEVEGKYRNRDCVSCCLDKEEKESLDKINWTL